MVIMNERAIATQINRFVGMLYSPVLSPRTNRPISYTTNSIEKMKANTKILFNKASSNSITLYFTLYYTKKVAKKQKIQP